MLGAPERCAHGGGGTCSRRSGGLSWRWRLPARSVDRQRGTGVVSVRRISSLVLRKGFRLFTQSGHLFVLSVSNQLPYNKQTLPWQAGNKPLCEESVRSGVAAP